MHKKESNKKFMYYLDEISIFVICIIGVALSDTLKKVAEGHLTTTHDIFLTWPQFLISSIVAVIVYGGMYQSWKFGSNKPAWIKRASNALMHGIAWRSVVSLGMGK